MALRGSGEPLAGATRATMESRFGHDFSQVRVHADKAAAASARDVDALAYTLGQDIVFAAGHYAPHHAAGRQLLAHELVHVVQQSSAGANMRARLKSAPPTIRRKSRRIASRRELPWAGLNALRCN